MQWLAIGSWQQPTERITEVDPLKTTWEVAQELSVYYSTVIQHLKQIRKVKKLDKWVLHELTTNEKSHPFQVFSSLILCNNEPFLDQIVMYNKKWIFIWQPVMTSSVTGLKRSSKALPKAKLAPKKGSWSLVGYQFDRLQLSESQWNHYIWELCSANQWDAPKTAMPAASTGQQRAQFFSMTTPDCIVSQPILQKLNELGYKVLLHLPYSPGFCPTDYHFLKHLDNFLQGKSFHNQQEAENAFQEFVESWSPDFYSTRISKLISHWQKMCWF